ncbi:hypothetical protein [Streptomyces alkaliphilus]|uniref:Twin-arginine translocation signal domain-containing protein n=1 Tax=Streptomyces alkaliphilus TaxID=1472722 RepID=A0A7W3TB71_9ACTN|nr:hypothetical protein [Streptomyces alkaliphilus]MBB0243651.1 hypothetical protein [Streptomyces alkaliphilus]MQS06604.1 hypothetical protein [Streptomyces alkaliphilus]
MRERTGPSRRGLLGAAAAAVGGAAALGAVGTRSALAAAPTTGADPTVVDHPDHPAARWAGPGAADVEAEPLNASVGCGLSAGRGI